MANNPYVNKVNFGNQTVMDISDTTATEGDVISGKTFYKANGARSTGSAVIPDISNCYQTTDTAETDIADGDYFPFYDTSATAKRKTLWSNVKSKLQTAFESVFRKKYIARFAGEGDPAGYCLLCTLVVQRRYIDAPTEIVLQERGKRQIARVQIRFAAADTYDPSLEDFIVVDSDPKGYFLVKSATSTWQLYVNKPEAYSVINVIDCSVYNYDGGLDSVAITWNCQNSSLPNVFNAARPDYKCDNSVIAPLEPYQRASQAYTKGTHFIRDGAFCTAKTAIAANDLFALNTNYTASSIGASLTNLDTVDNILNDTNRTSGVTITFAKLYKNEFCKVGEIYIIFKTTTVPSSGGVCLGGLKEQYFYGNRPVYPLVNDDDALVEGSIYINLVTVSSGVRAYGIRANKTYIAVVPIILA